MKLALALILLPSLASAQACGNRGEIIARLQDKWGERFAGGGLRSATSVYEVWVSDEKRTWTILSTNANGTTCIMASGTNWRSGAEMTTGRPL